MGRYALSLTKELVRQGRDHDFFFLLNRRLLPTSRPLLDDLRQLNGRRVLFDGPVLGTDRTARPIREQVGGLLRNDRIETLGADVYHVWSLFEGDSVYDEALPWLSLPESPVVNSVTTYDLIPAIFPDEYLCHSDIRSWFNRTASVARTFDVHLAISNATKRDVERYLRVEPAKVVNILGDVDPFFRVLSSSEARRGRVWAKLGDAPFVLYVGGPDFRKNIFGIVDGFAAIVTSLPRPHKLVLVLSLDEGTTQRLEARAAQLGIAEFLFITGFISNEELRELYNACSLFVFPSIYEGLGMPVIEAMRCGAPVVVGDNSSLVEVVDDADCRFDATRSDAIADALRRALGDPDRLARMRRYSHDRAREFSWEKSAAITLQAWRDAADRKTKAWRSQSAPLKPRIAMFTPLPREKTGIADYAADFMPALSRHAAIELFVDDVLTIDETAVDVPVWHHSVFAQRRADFDVVIYQLGNSPFHRYMWPYLTRYPGVVVLHDAFLGNLGLDPADPLPFLSSVIEEEGGAARELVANIPDPSEAARALIERFSCGGAVVDASLGAIVHSAFARSTLRARANLCTGVDIAIIQQYRAGVSSSRNIDKSTARGRLGLDPQRKIVASFGHVASTKGILELVAAFRASDASARGAELVFVGELEGGAAHTTPYAQAVLAALDGQTNIRITGFVDQETYDLWLRAVDMGVQLRTLSKGETSGAMLNLLMNEKPLVFNRIGAAAEFPTDVAFGIDDFEPSTIRAALDRLLSDEDVRHSLARSAGAYVRKVLDPDAIAERFVATAVGMAARARACGPKPLARKIASVLAASPSSRALNGDIAAAYVRQERSEAAPRLLIEVGTPDTLDVDLGALLRAAFRYPGNDLQPRAFNLGTGQPMVADSSAQMCGAMLSVEPTRGGVLDLRPFDRVLIARDALSIGAALRPLAQSLQELGGALVAIVGDMGPIDRPGLYSGEVADTARDSLEILMNSASGLICSTFSAADSLARVHVPNLPLAQRPSLAFVPHAPRPQPVHERPQGGNPSFLFEPPIRLENGHGLVLDAFERHWTDGGMASLVVVRGIGWDECDAIDSYASHAEYGRRLHIVAAGDRQGFYAQASAAIVATETDDSRDALYAALDWGLQVVLADTMTVSRQDKGTRIALFHANDAASLAQTITAVSEEKRTPDAGSSGPDEDPTSAILQLARGEGWETFEIRSTGG